MNPNSENFDQLRKLLALKRHEQPPPRYFNDFSGQVIARIRAGEHGEDGLAWVRKLWSLMEGKPMLTGAFGAAVCALVISGIVFSDSVEPTAEGVHATGMDSPLRIGTDPLAMNRPSDAGFMSSTNPVSPVLRSLLDGVPLNSQPASAGFGFPGGY